MEPTRLTAVSWRTRTECGARVPGMDKICARCHNIVLRLDPRGQRCWRSLALLMIGGFSCLSGVMPYQFPDEARWECLLIGTVAAIAGINQIWVLLKSPR